MNSKIKEVKVINDDGTSQNMDIGANAHNVDMKDGSNVEDRINALIKSDDKQDNSIQGIENNLDNINNKVDAAVSGSPAGVYDNLQALIAADPDHSKIYLTLDNGNWNYFNTETNTWIAGGVYQTSEGVATLKDLDNYYNKKEINDISNVAIPEYQKIIGKYRINNNIYSHNSFFYTSPILLNADDEISFKGQGYLDNVTLLCQVDENNNWVNSIQNSTSSKPILVKFKALNPCFVSICSHANYGIQDLKIKHGNAYKNYIRIPIDKWTPHSYIDTHGQLISYPGSLGATDFIEVPEQEKCILAKLNNNAKDDSSIAFYDKNRALIDTINYEAYTKDLSFTTPRNTVYIRATINSQAILKCELFVQRTDRNVIHANGFKKHMFNDITSTLLKVDKKYRRATDLYEMGSSFYSYYKLDTVKGALYYVSNKVEQSGLQYSAPQIVFEKNTYYPYTIAPSMENDFIFIGNGATVYINNLITNEKQFYVGEIINLLKQEEEKYFSKISLDDPRITIENSYIDQYGTIIPHNNYKLRYFKPIKGKIYKISTQVVDTVPLIYQKDNYKIMKPTIQLGGLFYFIANNNNNIYINNSGKENVELPKIYESNFYINMDSVRIMENHKYINLSAIKNFGVIGDSYASGELWYNGSFHDDYSRSWGQIMARKFGTKCVNYSSGGQTTRSWLTSSNGLSKMLKEQPNDIYYLALGINDYGASGYGMSYLGMINDITDFTNKDQYRDSFYGNYGKIIENIKEHAPHAKIIMFTLAKDTGVPHNFNEAIKEIAQYYKIPYIEQSSHEFFKSKIYTSMNHGHPVAFGYAGMADAFEELIQQCIEKNWNYFFDMYGY